LAKEFVIGAEALVDTEEVQALLEAQELKKYFPITKGLLVSRIIARVRAVDGVSLRIGKGHTYGLVGESGCGKTTLAKLIMLIERPTSGRILFRGQDINGLRGQELQKYRSSIQMVCQDPTSSMNPRMRVKDIVGEPLTVGGGRSGKEIQERVAEALDQVKLPEGSGSLYPHEFSGGQRQRIAVARALAPGPECIVLDEPVSALDISIRAQIMNLLMDLQAQLGHSYLLIAHDLAVVRYMSTYVGVMYLGKLVEFAESAELYTNPLHPYTQALLNAVLPNHPDMAWTGGRLAGEVPSPIDPPPGCRFHPRCSRAKPGCAESEAPLAAVSGNHWVACHSD
jgi:oligopeptide transport system ATP-binding protein